MYVSEAMHVTIVEVIWDGWIEDDRWVSPIYQISGSNPGDSITHVNFRADCKCKFDYRGKMGLRKMHLIELYVEWV